MGVVVFKRVGCGQGRARPLAACLQTRPAPGAEWARGRVLMWALAWVWVGVLGLLLAALPPLAAAQAVSETGLRFAPLSDHAASSLPAALFNENDRAAAAAEPLLRVAVQQAPVPALVSAAPGDELQGPLVQWLQALAAALGLQLSPVLVADEAAQLQAVREGRADLALAVNPPFDAPQPGLVYSLGTGAQPLAWVLLREERPVPLERARIALLDSGNSAEPATADRIRRHYPGAAVQLHASVEKALQAVVDRRADAYVGNLLPVLALLQQKDMLGLELRQVWPGAAGHRHLVLREARAALLPALNKALAAWRAAQLPHEAVLRTAHQAALGLRLPLALPGDVKGADTAVMDGLIQPPYGLPASALEREPLGLLSTWRVGVLRNSSAPVAALSGLNAQGRHTGVAADMLQEMALQLGVVLQLQAFDSEAALVEALRSGRIDVAPLLEFTPDQAPGLMFSLPWLELPQVLVGRDGGTPFWGLESLRGRRLALATGHPQRAELQRLHPGIQLVDAADGAAALALLQKGQADAAMDIKPVVQTVLATPAGQGLQVLGDVANFTTRYRIGVPEAHRALLPLLDAALTDVNAQERQRSVQRWLVQEAPPQSPPWLQQPWAWPALAGVMALVLVLAGGLGWRTLQRHRVAAAEDAAPSDAAHSGLHVEAARGTARAVPRAAAEPLSVSELDGEDAAWVHAAAVQRARPDAVQRTRPDAVPAVAQPPVPEAAREPEPSPWPVPVPMFSPEPMPAPMTEPMPMMMSVKESEPQPVDVPLPEPFPKAVPEPLPVAVSVPVPVPEPVPEPVPVPVPVPAPSPVARAIPAAAPATRAPAPPLLPLPAAQQPDAFETGARPSLFERAVAAGIVYPPPAPSAPANTAAPSSKVPALDIDTRAHSLPALWPSRPMPLSADGALVSADPYEDLHLEQLLDVLMVPYYRQSEGQSLRLVWVVDPVLPARIHSDPARLTHLIKLLMSRALVLTAAHGGPGLIAFKASTGKLDSGKPALTLMVKAACPAQAEGHAMERELQQAADTAAELGGHLDLRSREGVGHSVMVRLPLRVARREDRSPMAP